MFTLVLSPQRQRIMVFLRAQGQYWSSREQVLSGAQLTPEVYDDEISWLHQNGVIECRRIKAMYLTPAQRGNSSAPQQMVRLQPHWQLGGRPTARTPQGPPTITQVPAPEPRATLRVPMVIQAACLSLAGRVTTRLRPHLHEFHYCSPARICPAVRLAIHLPAQSRARLRPLLAGLTGRRATAPPWEDDDLSQVYAVWQDLCALAGDLDLNPSEAISEGYSYVLEVARLLSQELAAPGQAG